MDRFTRTREHYLKGAPRESSHQARPALAPTPAADLIFDFDFGESKIDLTLGVGDTPHSTVQAEDPTNDRIGIAISDDSDFPQRGRLRISKPCTITIQNHHERGLNLNQEITALPPVPGEVRIRFNSRNEKESKKPSFSIYSREGRRQVKREITPPGKRASGGAAKNTGTDSSDVSGDSMVVNNFQEGNSESEPKRSASLEQNLSAFSKKQTDKSPSRQSQTTYSDQRTGKDKTKRSSIMRKILSIFKQNRTAKNTTHTTEGNNPARDKHTPSSPTAPTSSTNMPPDEEGRPVGGRLGEAFRASIAEKQTHAQNSAQPGPILNPPASLRGGGGVQSSGQDRVWQDLEIRRTSGFPGLRQGADRSRREAAVIAIAGDSVRHEDDVFSEEEDASAEDGPFARVRRRRRHRPFLDHSPDCPLYDGSWPCCHPDLPLHQSLFPDHHPDFPGYRSGRLGREPWWPNPRLQQRDPAQGNFTPPPGTPRGGSQVRIVPFPVPERHRRRRTNRQSGSNSRDHGDDRRRSQRPERRRRHSRERGPQGHLRGRRDRKGTHHTSDGGRNRQLEVPFHQSQAIIPVTHTPSEPHGLHGSLPTRTNSQPQTQSFGDSQTSLPLRPKTHARPVRPGTLGTSYSGPSPAISRSIPITGGGADRDHREIAQSANSSSLNLDAESEYATPIRITLSDGRSLTLDEYRALEEKRAGKKRASTPSSTARGPVSPSAAAAGLQTAEPPEKDALSAIDLLRQRGGISRFDSTGIALRSSVRCNAVGVHATAKSSQDKSERPPPVSSYAGRALSAKPALVRKTTPDERAVGKKGPLFKRIIGEKEAPEHTIAKAPPPKSVPTTLAPVETAPNKTAFALAEVPSTRLAKLHGNAGVHGAVKPVSISSERQDDSAVLVNEGPSATANEPATSKQSRSEQSQRQHEAAVANSPKRSSMPSRLVSRPPSLLPPTGPTATTLPAQSASSVSSIPTSTTSARRPSPAPSALTTAGTLGIYRSPSVPTAPNSSSSVPVLRLCLQPPPTPPTLDPSTFFHPVFPPPLSPPTTSNPIPPQTAEPPPPYTPLPTPPEQSTSTSGMSISAPTPPALSIRRELGRTPLARIGRRPLPTVIQIEHVTDSSGNDEGGDGEGEPGWSFTGVDAGS